MIEEGKNTKFLYWNKRDDGKYGLFHIHTFHIIQKDHLSYAIKAIHNSEQKKSINEEYIVATKGKTKKKSSHVRSQIDFR